MSESFFDKVRALDTFIAAGPKGCSYSRDLQRFLLDDALNEYFFRRIEDPDWLKLLVAAKKFASVPAPETNQNDGTIGFPSWPEGEYLQRIARVAPALVCEVTMRLPETQNARVHSLLLEIAIELPPEHAVKLVPKVAEAVRSPYQLGVPLKIGHFISALSKARQTESALQLAEATLEVSEDPKLREGAAASLFANHLEPRVRFGLWEYEQIIKETIPDLVDASPDSALKLLCDLLDRAIVLSDRRGAEQRPNDYSHVWRPAIEEHQQNLNMGAKHLLVSGVRNAAEQVARTRPKSVPEMVQMLEKRGDSWWVFRRIGLHVLRLNSEFGMSLVHQRLTDRRLFDALEVRHEYFLLQQACFGQLPREQQQIVFTWIEQGPRDVDDVMKRWAELTGRPGTTDDWNRYVQSWKRDRLAPLERHLDEDWKETYARLCESGRSQHPEFTSYHEGGAWGPSSPLPRAELSKMAVNELVTYLGIWRPSGDEFRGPSFEGLARELTATVSEQPEKYASGAAEFMRLSEPTYVRAVVQGFRDALKQRRKFEWLPLLALCTWAVGHPREIPGRVVNHFEMDPHWGWTTSAVIELLTEGLASEDNPISPELRYHVWRGIEAGTNAPEPTVDQEAKYLLKEAKSEGEKGHGYCDPFTNAINSPRGIAIGAVVQFALWLRRGFERSQGKETLLAQGFEAMPEVQRVLDAHLDEKIDPSISIRSVYGERIPWLHLLDEKWARQNTARLFPRNQTEHWHAAWDTYIGFCAPYDKVLDWLKDEYAFAVEQIGNHEHGWSQPQAPDYALAQHLVSFYWRGRLKQQDPIFETFYSRADGKLRGHALNFIGRSLRNTAEAIPEQIQERLKALWAKHIELAKRKPAGTAEEMKEFGWWFVSRKFDDDWSLRQLIEALRLAHRVEPDHLVVGRLADLSGAMPLLCVEALMLMVEGDEKGWAIQGWTNKPKEIIRTARASGNSAARKMAEELVNLLGSRRYFDFGELLKEPIKAENS